MMSEHLRIVFSSLFDVDHDHLLQPEGKLDKVIPFEYSVHLSSRPVGP